MNRIQKKLLGSKNYDSMRYHNGFRKEDFLSKVISL